MYSMFIRAPPQFSKQYMTEIESIKINLAYMNYKDNWKRNLNSIPIPVI